MRSTRLVAVVLSIALAVSPAAYADQSETFGQKLLSSAASSAGSKGGEFAVKFVAGWIYNISCKPEQQRDEGSKALCGALGSLSGKTEEEWKKQVIEKLDKISGKLDAIESGQKYIVNLIQSQHKAMEKQIENLPNEVAATAITTTIDALWARFDAEFNTKKTGGEPVNFNKVDLEKFAADVMRQNLHAELGRLNVLLTSGSGKEPLLLIPFQKFRDRNSLEMPPEAWSPMESYDFAEKRFAFYRGEMQKGYLVYLWAAEVIQSECEIKHDERCAALPMTSTAFDREYQRYTNDQISAFDSFAHAVLLAYSVPNSDNPNFLVLNRPVVDRLLMRINYLTSTVIGTGQGAWGEVISADGDPWDGTINTTCNGTKNVLKPVLSYRAKGDTRWGPFFDWWTSRAKNGTYDEVHFSPNWRIYHYKIEGATPGPCRVEPRFVDNQPVPWRSEDSEVVNVTKNGETYPVGFFYAIQRAGGTYALASGQNWALPAPPGASGSGDATVKHSRFDSMASGAHHESAWMGLLDEARVEQTFMKTATPTQQAKVSYQMYAYNHKSIYFPEGGTLKLRYWQHTLCDKLCRGNAGSEPAILDYDVENSQFEDGSLTAIVAVFLDPKQGLDGVTDRAKNGVFLNGSYGNTRERKTMHVEHQADGNVQVTPGTAYHLQYFIDFDLKTNTSRADATTYRLLAKVTPMRVFVTK